ncbi:CBN-DAF-6 protein [Caenorhabditis brenneri]|uniref:CBN-DAF-6 protein n=1 Tax=Caenorhabditis brenneri TaxID=135651 RepID=G0MB46_CAEBE|nr:CBN-DAF-6 protein [Caenorhabditis brenneri]
MKDLRVDDPAYVFTPSDARWRREINVFNENWPLDENKFLPGKSFETKRFVNILIRAKDGGSIMRDNVLQEIEILNQWIMYNISVPTDDMKYNLTYQELCMNYDWVCGANEHIQMLIRRNDVNQILDLHFPRGGTKDTPVYLGSIFGDVNFYENGTVSDAKLTQLFYFLKQNGTNSKRVEEYSSKFSYAIETFLNQVYSSDVITLSFAHYQSLEDGLDENAKAFVPNFVVSFFVLGMYALISSFTLKASSAKKIDWISSKPWLAAAGMFTTVLSIVSAFGFLFILGVHYNVINTIIPFLIIAIGIDDMFLMNACWDQTSKTLTVPERMSKTLSHAGVAVTITNVTDIMSFAIGCITDLPGIQFFCIYACVSVAFSYLYQLTFFSGAMAIMGEVEREKRHCLFFYRTFRLVDISKMNEEADSKLAQIKSRSASPAPFNYLSSSNSSFSSDTDSFSSKKTIPAEFAWKEQSSTNSSISKKSNEPHEEKDRIVHFLGKVYGPFILSNPVRMFSLFVFIIYMVIAMYGCYNFREGLNPGNLVTNDHYIAKYFTDIKHFWRIGPQLHVAVLNPPNLTLSENRNRVFEVVSAFENTPYTLGREGTVFFLFEYLNYLADLNVEIEDTEKLWKNKLASWLKYTGGSTQWANNIRINKTDGSFQSFRFQIALKNFVEPNDHKHAAKLLREIADHQPFNVVVYHEAFPFADQYLIILPATIQNVLISLLCMAVVSFLLVPSLPSGFVIFVSIVSINIGVFGYMTLWGVNLDAVSMISIIMSIGFAVDLSAHIIYAFVTSHGNTNERVIGALETLGWPIFQGASSTIAGISILYTVDAYIILVFFKTIWLTMLIGAIHGLFFIPVFLSLFPVEFFRIPKSSELH